MQRSAPWILFGSSLLLYLLLLDWFPLIPQYSRELADISTFLPSVQGAWGYLLWLLLQFTLSAALAWGLHRGFIRWRMRKLLLSSFLFGLPLLWVYPINANDVFRYFMRGRILAIYGGNPLAQPLSSFPNDPFVAQGLGGEWYTATSPYGPLWELIDGAVVWLSGDRLLVALLLFKLLGLLALIGCGYLIYALNGTPSLVSAETDHHPPSNNTRLALSALWLWNPAAFLMFVVDGHNDALMLFWLLLGLYLIRNNKRLLLGTSALCLAPLTKAAGIVAIPFIVIEVLRALPDWSVRLRYVASSAVVGLALTWLLFLPFGSPRYLLLRLTAESQSSGGFSPLALLYFIGQNSAEINVDVFQLAGQTPWLIAAAAALLLLRTLAGRPAVRSVADIFWLYVYTAFRFRIWYTLWIFPWVLLDAKRPERGLAAWLMLFAAQSSVILYGQLRQHYLSGSIATAHFIAIPFVFLMPWVAALSWGWVRKYRSNST